MFIHVCVPGVLDLEEASAAELVTLARLRHGTECRPAHVKVGCLILALAVD
jgi:hypothetical protein